MVAWHHQLNEHEFKQVLGVGDGQRSLAGCSPWGCKESDMTEQLSTAHFFMWISLGSSCLGFSVLLEAVHLVLREVFNHNSIIHFL